MYKLSVVQLRPLPWQQLLTETIVVYKIVCVQTVRSITNQSAQAQSRFLHWYHFSPHLCQSLLQLSQDMFGFLYTRSCMQPQSFKSTVLRTGLLGSRNSSDKTSTVEHVYLASALFCIGADCADVSRSVSNFSPTICRQMDNAPLSAKPINNWSVLVKLFHSIIGVRFFQLLYNYCSIYVKLCSSCVSPVVDRESVIITSDSSGW